MIYVQFLLGCLLYSCMAYLSYSSFLKNSPYYFVYGVTMAALVNALWFAIAKAEVNASTLMLKGLYWDVMLTATYLVVPLLIFNAKVTLMQGLGIAFIVAGVFLTKM